MMHDVAGSARPYLPSARGGSLRAATSLIGL